MKDNETKFGFQIINKKDKTKKVGEVFDSVTNNYDLMNNLMSFGLHKLWKKFVIESARLRTKAKILDIASGTADLTLSFSKLDKDFEIYQTDINYSMLAEGQEKITDQGKIIPGIVCDAEAIPFPNNYFDCVTIAFGLRNMTNINKALSEIYRVISPGGKVIILEFSHVHKPLKKIYDLFSFRVIPKLGKIFANDEKSYQYLVESIRVHPNQEELKKIMQKEKFENISYVNMNGGIVAIHKGYKI